MNVNKTKKNSDVKSRIITRQADEIESLKRTISSLEIDNEKKDALINSVDNIRGELDEIVRDLRLKSEEYDNLISDLEKMKTVFNREVFKGRWRLIKLLMR